VDYFVDDLPEILKAAAFPARTTPILFDPTRENADELPLSVESWDDVLTLLRSRCSTSTP
jgi:hypothetical protein